VAIEAGKQLLHYRLVEKIGEGGMGAVWKAVDTTLDREVAIKILPDNFAADLTRLARFEREAKLLASLNHSHIATVYGLHQDPSASSGQADTRFLVMELVDGEDLSQRIERGPLPVDTATDIARQIAEGLEAAHESGVIHRDLKPANIKLTAAGQVKILDFGLAKALAPGSGESGEHTAQSATITSGGTVAGVILGTAAYMSPEQARGQPVDRRADIWAFGSVLYEMLTGRRTFDGNTLSDAVASILTREPEWSALPADVPDALRRLLVRCLDKEARTRLRDIGEARIVLSMPPPDEPEVDLAPARGRPVERIVFLAVIALLGGLLAWRILVPGGPDGAGDRVPSFRLQRITELPGPEHNPSLSPNGTMLLYDSAIGGNRDIYLQRVGGERAINLTEGSNADDHQAAFAPDGGRIAFRSERDSGGLFVMGATGESVRRVTDFGFNPAWSPDGRHLVFGTEAVDDPYSRTVISELWKVGLEDGSTTRLMEKDAVQPAWSPNGERIAFWANTGGQRDIWTIDAEGGEPAAVTMDSYTDWSPTWSPDGRWLYFSSDRGGSMNLWRVPIDASTGTARGEPQRVVGGVRDLGHAGFSTDGSNLDMVQPLSRPAVARLHGQGGTGRHRSAAGRWIGRAQNHGRCTQGSLPMVVPRRRESHILFDEVRWLGALGDSDRRIRTASADRTERGLGARSGSEWPQDVGQRELFRRGVADRHRSTEHARFRHPAVDRGSVLRAAVLVT
jgi:serine/threonine protein kinase/sugar lactone lactonase YvrE